jgi:hypothetical protein
MGDIKNAYNISFRSPEGNRPLGRPKYECEDNIQMDVTEIGNQDVDS